MKNKSQSLLLYIIIIIIIGIVFVIYKSGKFNTYYSDIKLSKNNVQKIIPQQKEIITKCSTIQKSKNIAEIFEKEYKSEFTGTGKIDTKNKMYSIVVTNINQGKKYQDFESQLFTILGEQKDEELKKPLKLQINFIYKFFYDKYFDTKFNCNQ